MDNAIIRIHEHSHRFHSVKKKKESTHHTNLPVTTTTYTFRSNTIYAQIRFAQLLTSLFKASSWPITPSFNSHIYKILSYIHNFTQYLFSTTNNTKTFLIRIYISRCFLHLLVVTISILF